MLRELITDIPVRKAFALWDQARHGGNGASKSSPQLSKKRIEKKLLAGSSKKAAGSDRGGLDVLMF